MTWAATWHDAGRRDAGKTLRNYEEGHREASCRKLDAERRNVVNCQRISFAEQIQTNLTQNWTGKMKSATEYTHALLAST